MSDTAAAGKFCVYHHVKPDGTVFYVGKGLRWRPYQRSARNPRWRAVVAAVGDFEVRIIGWYGSSMEALRAERADMDRLKPEANIIRSIFSNREGPTVAFRTSQIERDLAEVVAKRLKTTVNAMARAVFDLTLAADIPLASMPVAVVQDGGGHRFVYEADPGHKQPVYQGKPMHPRNEFARRALFLALCVAEGGALPPSTPGLYQPGAFREDMVTVATAKRAGCRGGL